MYPISADQNLGLREIADHWAGELGQPNRDDQLLQNLIRAWWAGEFGPVEAERRLPALKLLYKYHRNDMTFLISGDVEPETTRELPDGGAVVNISYMVRLPNEDPSSWTQENCALALKELADRWVLRLIPDATDNLALIKISEAEFTGYLRARSYNRPKFWAEGKNPGDSVLATVSPTNSAHKRRGRPPDVFNRVVEETRENISENRTTPDGLWGTVEKILALEYRCSRDTVRKARAAVAARSVEN
jgi:hypothetical protein